MLRTCNYLLSVFYHHHPHFTDGETDAQGGQVRCPQGDQLGSDRGDPHPLLHLSRVFCASGRPVRTSRREMIIRAPGPSGRRRCCLVPPGAVSWGSGSLWQSRSKGLMGVMLATDLQVGGSDVPPTAGFSSTCRSGCWGPAPCCERASGALRGIQHHPWPLLTRCQQPPFSRDN